MNFQKNFSNKDKVDFWISWSIVFACVLFFAYGLTIIYRQSNHDISYVEMLEEQVFSLKEQNMDLKHELRQTIHFYTMGVGEDENK